MISPSRVLLALSLGSISTFGQNLPSEFPAGCDGSSCNGCTPFQPPEGSARDYPCGINDIYFPVPIYAIRNDTSVGREIESRQWACFACCALGCGFDDPQNTCAYTNYEWKEGNKYGCTKCGGKDVSAKGGEVKTSLADLSTQSIYTTLVTPYGACAPEDTVSPSPPPTTTPTTPTTPTTTPSPPTATTPPTSPSPAGTGASPPATSVTPATPVTPSPPVTVPVPSPAVQVAEAPAPVAEEPVQAPTEFIPIDIGSTTGPVSSSGLMAGSATISAVLAAMMCIV